MMTILRNHQDPKRQPNQEVREQCKEALAIYKGLGWQEKSSFLQQFEAKGGFKNLSWVRDFTQSAEIKDQTAVTCNEGYMTLGQVLQCLGYSLSDFSKTEEAVALVEEAVAKNQAEHNSLEKISL